jgi:hypothetical protein
MNNENMVYVHTMEYDPVINYRTNPVIYSKMNGSKGHCVKLKRPNIEREVLCAAFHWWRLKTKSSSNYERLGKVWSGGRVNKRRCIQVWK